MARKGASMYSPTRNGLRVGCDDKCLLRHNGLSYQCLLENISISGALVCLQDFKQAAIQVGDTCGLLLCTDPTVCPGEYTSRVTRLGASKIALHFLDIASETH